VSSWANDTIRFIKMYWNDLRGNPLKVYSLFAFMPKSTIFHTEYTKSTKFPHPVVTIGLEDNWPPYILIKAHSIEDARLSSCGNWFVTCGDDGSQPVYGVWNVRLGDGETHIHPCGTADCHVSSIRIYDGGAELNLQTFCGCGSLYRWDASFSPPILIEEMKLERGLEHRWWSWSEDGKMAVRECRKEDGSKTYSLWRNDNQGEYCALSERGRHSYGRWTFSPGKGDKLAYWSREDEYLEVWDSISGKLLYVQKLFRMMSVLFSPDGKTVIILNSQRISNIFTETGNILWDIKVDLDKPYEDKIEFSPDGSMVLIAQKNDLRILHAINGSILHISQNQPGSATVLFPNSDNEQVIIRGSEGVLLWNRFRNPSIELHGQVGLPQGLAYFSWKHSTLIERFEDRISFSNIDLTWPLFPRSHTEISRLLLSPNGLHLVTVFADGTIALWDTIQGGQCFSTFFNPIYPSKAIELAFTRDSSTLLIWRMISQEMQLIYIPRLSIEFLHISNFVVAAFLSASKRILSIDGNGNINIHSFNGMLLETPSHLSFHPSSPLCHSLITSLDDRIMAMIYRGSLIVKEIFSNSQEVEWPGACIAVAFTLDYTHIFVVEHLFYDAVISRLRIVDMKVQERWAMTKYGSQVTPKYEQNTLQLTEKSGNWKPFDSLISSFDLLSGRRIISGFLHHRGYSVLYCQCHIMHTEFTEEGPDISYWDSSNHFIAWIEDNTRPHVVNMSSLVLHA
jgi:WD40 repeat protein